jgi:serine/threonine-protein kinase RsbW
MSSFECELELADTRAALTHVAEFVEKACEQAGVTPAAQFDIQLAVEEACCNVIEHAYEGDGGKFSVRFETRGPDVVITVCDWGRPFNPNEVASPDLGVPLEERPVGGLGLHLMRQLMDEVRFTFSETGNQLEMVKRGILAERAPRRSRPGKCKATGP